MKKVTLLLGVLFSVIVLNAHNVRQQSDLTIKLWDNSSFQVYIDHEPYGKTNSFKLENLSAGVHHIKVVKRKRNRYGNGGFREVLYSSNIRIPKNSRVIATVTPYKNIKLHVRNKQHRHQHHQRSKQQVRHSNNRNGCNHYGACSSSCRNYVNRVAPRHAYAMRSTSFNRLLNVVRSETFDADKLLIVKQALMYNQLTSNQVVAVMNQFTFDNSKLEFTKLAYTKTVDKENYYVVSNGFTFSRSKNKLAHYISTFG